MITKVRKTLTLDQDVVSAFEGDADSLSATVNDILRAELDRRTRVKALRAFADDLDALHGPADPGLVDHFRRLLS